MYGPKSDQQPPNSGFAGGFSIPNPNQPGYPNPPPGYPVGPPAYPAQPGQPGQPILLPQPPRPFPPGGSYNTMRGGYDSDAENGGGGEGPFNQGFSDKAIRRGFIRKVYGILMVQLIITGAFISVFTFVPSVRLWSVRNQWTVWVAFAILMVCMISMACCEGVRRKSPTNFIFLGIFTAAEGFMLGTTTAHFDADAILMAVGICAAVCLALTLFAFQTKWDFTACGGMLCALMVVLMIMGLVMIFVPYNKYAMIGYGAVGALIFSLYIVYDTQLMMGGKHKYSLDPEEYIFAALNLYLDIINLFMYILMIISAARSD